MPYGVYVSAEGALAQSRRMEVIANNLANAGTTGFKRDLAIVQARNAEALDQGLVMPGSGAIDEVGGGVMVRETRTDYSVGPLTETGMPTDLALPGEGFFVIRRGDQDLLTRAGNFEFNATGMLVTQDGYPVVAQTGDIVQIEPTEGPWDVTPDGAVVQGGTRIPLAIVQPASLGDLVKVGENLFSPLAPTGAVASEQRRVAAGFLEQSGVRPTTEMMEMIETSRAFEANVNMIRHRDQMISSLLSRVLRGS